MLVVGPTITLVEVQARWMAALLAGRIALPARAAMAAEIERHRASVARRYVNAARYTLEDTLEVDFKEYTGQLAHDLR